ncbi:hypothetical protein KM043_013810 [Ampulex compressa]|nr:hypothetical protein KM043_013810 [Ampulex compressa]
MTLTPSAGQSMQLTPLWEHVVRTRRFPSEVDTQQTFLEISERLRDPEWEVRQHALRVLMDVLPTLNADVVDKAMQPVVPELINNLGHPAPAVRKGALDTLRVYLVYSHDKDNVVKNILHEGLNRPEPHDAFQTNVTTGIILSAPSLLFPASCSPPPAEQLVKDTTIALASRLAQVPHQEAVLKSLMKIRDAVGTQLYDDYLASYDPKLRKNIELLCKIYNVKSNRGTRRKEEESKEVCKLEREDRSMDRTWESDSDTSGIAEEEDETGSMPPARVVLETEIKFNEETAITMTILEEKDEESESDKDAESGTDLRNDMEALEVKDPNDRRRTPRRVHFGGEIVKLRTPDSDETESLELNRKTRIPLPVSPATKMPAERPRRRPSSQPCSPLRESRRPRRVSRSVSSSPKREVYTHNAELSPKKGILARTSSPVFIIKPVEQHSAGRKRRSVASRNNEGKGAGDKEWATSEFSSGNVEDVLKASKVDPRITTLVEKERVLRNNENPEITSSDGLLEAKDPQDTRNSTMNDKQFLNKKESFEGGMKRSNRKTDNTNVSSLKRIVDGNQSTNISSTTKGEDKSSAKQAQKNTALAQNKNMFEVFPRQERNYILMELSSPERKTSAEKKITSEAVTLPEEERTIQGEVLSSDIQNDLTEHPESMNDVGIEEFTVGVSMEEKRISEIGAEDRSENIVEVIAEATRKKSAENPRAFPTDEAKSRIVKSEVTFVDAEKSSETKCERSSNNATKNAAVVNAENPGSDVKTINSGDNERIPWKGRGKDRADAIEGSVTRNGREGESKPKEPNWEELGLVDQEVLEDLHNKVLE